MMINLFQQFYNLPIWAQVLILAVYIGMAIWILIQGYMWLVRRSDKPKKPPLGGDIHERR